jgi:hypothetical protein
MKLKAAHLLRRLERIHRDLEELDDLQKSIREDREYAGRLRNSLVDESIRLNTLRERVLTQVIRPPEQQGTGYWQRLQGDQNAPTAQVPLKRKESAPPPRSEISIPILPEQRSTPQSDRPALQSVPADRQKSHPNPKASAKKENKPANAPFRFHYDRASDTQKEQP